MSTVSRDRLETADGRSGALRERYESLLWGTMDRLGITGSVERKIMAAVVLQFCSTLVVFALPLAFLGPRTAIEVFPTGQLVLTAVVFALAVIAFVNTLLIARQDVIEPLRKLRGIADEIASGRLEDRPEPAAQSDEIGELHQSFGAMYASLTTVAEQADALAREDFEADVLEEDVPGAFGSSLERMQTGLRTRIDELEESRERIERQRETVERRNEALEADAERCRAVLRRCADGDFTHRVTIESDHEAMQEIADGVNAMLDDIEGMLHSVQALADEVDEVGREVSTSVEEIETASDSVSESAEEISHMTDEQNDRFEGVRGEMSALSATIEEIASTADGVADVSDRAATHARSGRETAREAIDELERIERRTEAIVDRIEALEGELGEVGDIVEVIDGIAEETNLLAVNASIEAARAGESGKRFAVVANEIQSLSEETGEATRDVDELVSSVQASAQDAVEEIRRMQRDVADGTETIDESLAALEGIADDVQEANDGVQSINDATDEQARTSQQVVSMVDDATELSERTLRETSSVAAAAEEQTATISELSTAVDSLSDTAAELNGQLAEFTVTN
ncbi:methyl-accepting chemotaxis protein [Halopiger djelfimassiliensis]|uniref:methyl-accepting chemotaxis protein n=1 Tax=Halopiger djelfimassiliensis TaxID=1293047 RepID=UPI0006782B7E|nr:HAMP domain-containing methyl-accepting chemotaxis protein [Halopiger djelfimassiliensis]